MKRKALYQSISEELESRILSGDVKPGDVLPSENRLAEQYGVSRITARQALVELEHKGYVTRKTGIGSIVVERTGNPGPKNGIAIIALILPFEKSRGRILDTFFGISNVLKDRDTYLTIHVTRYDSAKERTVINRLVNDGVNGIILYPWTQTRNIDLYHKLLMRKYPLVFIDRYYDSLPVSSVVSDNSDGVYRMTKHLIGTGHRNIMYVTDRDPHEVSTIRDRYFGFCRARSEVDTSDLNINDLIRLEIDTELALDALGGGQPLDHPLLAPVRSVLDRVTREKCSALVCVNDYVAITFCKVAALMGIRIPEDLSVCGFDDIVEGGYLAKPLSTVRQDFVGIGEQAAKLILEYVSAGKYDYRKVVQPVELVMRATTGSPA